MDWIGTDKVLEAYGSSEMYGGSTLVTGPEALAKPGTVGRPRYGPPRVLDETGREVSAGGGGHALVPAAGPAQLPLPGGRVPGPQGWETLGDMGYVDDDGYLFLADRRVDMIVTGGENVFPAEVEAALDQHPTVRSSVVIGLPDDDLGERVHAIVDVGRHDGAEVPVDPEDLVAFLGTRIVRYKIPRTFELVTEPLRTDAGKVRRTELRAERVAAGTGADARAARDGAPAATGFGPSDLTSRRPTAARLAPGDWLRCRLSRALTDRSRTPPPPTPAMSPARRATPARARAVTEKARSTLEVTIELPPAASNTSPVTAKPSDVPIPRVMLRTPEATPAWREARPP